MRVTVSDMCIAGMLLRFYADQIRNTELEGVSADAKQYLFEKMNDAFYDVQTDISLAVASTLGQTVTEIMEEDKDA